MNNLVIALMMLLVLGTGFLLGSKEALSDDQYGVLKANNNGSGNFKSHEYGNGDLSGNKVQNKTIDPGTFVFKYLWTIYGDIYYVVDSWIINLTSKPINNTNPFQVRISPDEAKNIAQKFIGEPGATVGEPKLIIIDEKATYIVPVVLDGSKVGEIYIDAQTGENLGGVGGVINNETNSTENNQLNDTELENTSGRYNNQGNGNEVNEGSVNKGSNNELSQANNNKYGEPVINSKKVKKQRT